MIFFFFIFFIRGISSTVRRCIEKETGREFAAKIIDLGAESGDVSSAQMLEATRQEIAILRQVMGHPYISECMILDYNASHAVKILIFCFYMQYKRKFV